MRAASAVSTHAWMISSSSVSLTLRRRSYSTSDSCVPRGGGIRWRWTVAISSSNCRWFRIVWSSQPARASSRSAAVSAIEAVAPSFHNWATVVRKPSRLTIRCASPTNSKSVGDPPVSNISPSIPSSALSR